MLRVLSFLLPAICYVRNANENGADLDKSQAASILSKIDPTDAPQVQVQELQKHCSSLTAFKELLQSLPDLVLAEIPKEVLSMDKSTRQ